MPNEVTELIYGEDMYEGYTRYWIMELPVCEVCGELMTPMQDDDPVVKNDGTMRKRFWFECDYCEESHRRIFATLGNDQAVLGISKTRSAR